MGSMKRQAARGATLALALAALGTAVRSVSAASLEEIIVTAARDTHTVFTDDINVAPADAAQLLRLMPGANVNRNGELTGIAQYRGMAGDRVNVQINGAVISSGGPNAMDAPLHYAPVAMLESVTISRGIAPVSAGQETLGGHVAAQTYRGYFTAIADFTAQGRLHLGGQTVNGGSVASGFFALANRQHILRASLMREEAGDSRFSGGEITPSAYQRQRYDVGYSRQRGRHALSLDYARNETGDAGTPALPMDIQSVDSDLFSGRYTWEGESLRLRASLGVNEVRHWMTNTHLRRPPQGAQGDEPMRFRQTFTTADSVHASLEIEHDTARGLWRHGADMHLANHDARIGNPTAAAFRLDNFHGVRRDVFGIYSEFNTAISDRIDLLIGARLNRVEMRAGEVSAQLNPMGLPSGMPVMMDALADALATRFNAGDRRQQDLNADWFVRSSLHIRSGLTGYLGAARKTRSPSYQERYLWIPMESTGGLADGRTYVGDPELRPETAHELEIGLDVEGARWSIYPRAFYRHVDDFIQGTPSADPLSGRFASMMAGPAGPGPLLFSNTEARLLGADIEGTLQIHPRWQLRGIASLVRATRRDIDDDLYRIAPDNMTLALDYHGPGWGGTLQGVFYARQRRVSHTQGEAATAGYALLDASMRRQLTGNLELVLGVNNLLDRRYRDHLAGYNRAWNADLAPLARIPGPGRNLFARMTWHLR